MSDAGPDPLAGAAPPAPPPVASASVLVELAAGSGDGGPPVPPTVAKAVVEPPVAGCGGSGGAVAPTAIATGAAAGTAGRRAAWKPTSSADIYLSISR